ncbi:MAG: T9SS type A sorting domain-containing protein [Ignavibacteriae bacterium]|nr:T9SS type A sorting domain-containing protein [Ignavibacteriota bacterium]
MKKIIFTIMLIILLVSVSYSQYGYRWIQKQSGTASSFYGSYFSNNSSNNYAGFICGANGTVFFSNDGYNTWLSKSVGINVNLYSIASASPNYNSIVCCGDDGTVLYSSNAGTNWIQLNSGTTAKLNCIVRSGTKLFATGNNGTIISSSWSGTAYSPFTQISSGTTQNLKSIYINSEFFACGDNGTVLKSTNLGVNWSAVPSPASVSLNSVYGYSTEINVCGNNGLYYKTTNNGLIWTSYPTGVTNNLNCLNLYYYIFGNSGTILYNKYTGSGQIEWEKMISPVTENLYYGLQTSNNIFFTFGSNGTILKREMDSSLIARKISGNNISTYMIYRGIFDQNIFSTNTPGFEWPAGSNKHAVFTTGLSAGCRINGQLAQTMCSYMGEYQPGCIINGQLNDSDIFKIYKVSKTENPPGQDWMNWGCMVPFGAPYVDVNHNGIYEPLIDTPGVKNAAQTLFVCLTDINPSTHSAGEGFGGGITSPLMGIELHLTKWTYNYPSFNDVVFTKFDILNKCGSAWNNTHFAIVSDPDIGDASDDWVGCDTIRNMGYCYNYDNDDPQYGTAPPAVGFDILKGPLNKSVVPNVRYNMSSFIRFVSPNATPPNEGDPNGEPYPAYLMLKGLKKDSSAWVDKTQPTPWGSYKRTKKIFYGDPETNEGWTSQKGYISTWTPNDSTGIELPETPGDKRIVIGIGADNYSVYHGDTATIWLAQLVARGSNNLNSVTKLKQLSDITQMFFESNFTIGINQISSEIPDKYSLEQNYPNPFNPATKIKYSVAKFSDVKLVVYDILGRKIRELVNEKQAPGVYEVLFDASSDKLKSLASGVYFYRLNTGNFSDTKRMLLIK